jgi:SOS-response transcriptional repressor LexA
MRVGLTRKQLELFRFIEDYIATHNGIAPSFQEMVEAVGIKSKSGVFRLVNALEDRGFIRRIPNRARAMAVIESPPSPLELVLPLSDMHMGRLRLVASVYGMSKEELASLILIEGMSTGKFQRIERGQS